MRTLLLVLRWYGAVFLSGIALTVLAAYSLATFQPAPADKAYLSMVSMIAPLVYIVGVLVGLAMATWATWKGDQLRSGGG